MSIPRPLVLVVDDSQASLDILVDALGTEYEICVATSGESALAAVAAQTPDLVLLDILMPDLDGYELCRRLKDNPATQGVPVIFLTALTDAGNEEEGLRLGAVDYIHKPANPALIRARVENHLSLRRAQLDLIRQRDELAAANEKLRNLERLRDNLVHMIVHDMRSPLTTMSFALEYVLDQDEPIQPKLHKLLSQSRAAVQELTRMSNTLLDISRLEAGEMPLKSSIHDVSVLLGRAVDAIRLQAEAKQIQISVTGPRAPTTLDEDLVYRVCVNLLVNAIKYTPTRGTIQGKVIPQETVVRVEVTDNGGGIPPEYHAKIFEKFGQIEARKAGQPHSAGLGLTFCKLAIERHGGQVGVLSEVGKGSTFWFTLPMTSGRQS